MALSVAGIFLLVAVGLALWYIFVAEHTRKIKVIVFVLIGVLLYLSIGNVVMNEPVDLSTPGGIFKGVYTYTTWVGQVFIEAWDIGAQTTGRVIDAVNETVN